MPRCSWCNEFTDQVERIDNGRTILVLCRLCAAEKELRESGKLDFDPQEITRVGVWQRLSRSVRRLFGGN